MNRRELLEVAAQLHAATIASNRSPVEELTVRDAARLIREVDRRAAMTPKQADYYDGVIRERPRRKPRSRR
jgi:hypothetical protein